MRAYDGPSEEVDVAEEESSTAGMLYMGADKTGRRYRVQVVGRIGDQRLLIQQRAPDGRSGWLECPATRLPVAARKFLHDLEHLCAHALAATVNPACELRADEDVGENEITHPTFDVGGELYLVGAK